jgi:hypothetical protein
VFIGWDLSYLFMRLHMNGIITALSVLIAGIEMLALLEWLKT